MAVSLSLTNRHAQDLSTLTLRAATETGDAQSPSLSRLHDLSTTALRSAAQLERRSEGLVKQAEALLERVKRWSE